MSQFFYLFNDVDLDEEVPNVLDEVEPNLNPITRRLLSRPNTWDKMSFGTVWGVMTSESLPPTLLTALSNCTLNNLNHKYNNWIYVK